MECKKCGKDLADKEYKKVAEWPFCLECFQALMDKAEEKKEEVTEPEVLFSAPEPEEKKQKCQVCSKELNNGEGRDMLGLLFCPDCYDVLVKSPAIPARPEPEEEEVIPKVAQVRVDLRKPTECHGCGRRIPVMGSKEFEGNRYCPDCYQALPEIQAQKPRPFPVAGADQQAEAGKEPGLRCQACNREVLPENLKTVEGFEICQACLKTNTDTALEIAQGRHRKAMEQMKKELDS